MGELGLFGLPIPEEYGGMGGDYLALCVAIEEIARVDSSLAITLEAGVSPGCLPVLASAPSEQRKAWLPPWRRARCSAPSASPRPAAGRTPAACAPPRSLDGDDWVINGSKSFITNSGTEITGLVTVTAVTGTRPDGREEVSAIIVPVGHPRASRSPRSTRRSAGTPPTPTSCRSSTCACPRTTYSGSAGAATRSSCRSWPRAASRSPRSATGLAQGCVDESVSYVQTRESFGRPIGTRQAIQFMVADMAVRAHLSRLAWRSAAARMVAGKPFAREAAIAKLYSSEAAMDNARAATQVHGGYGFMIESAVGRFYRDAKMLEIGEGTSEVQRMLIARGLGLPPTDRAGRSGRGRAASRRAVAQRTA